MNLETEVAGIKLAYPLMNGAGTCKTLKDVKELARSETAMITLGSITKDRREGNPGNPYYACPLYSQNSLGMPNLGSKEYQSVLPEMVEIAHGEGKKLCANVAGLSVEEYPDLAEMVLTAGADLVELNLGCPNVWKDGVQKRIVCFSPDLVGQVLQLVQARIGASAPVSVKLSHFSDPFQLAEVLSVVAEFEVVKAVTSSNTSANSFGYQGTKPRIDAGGGYAGFAGPAFKPIALGQVRQIRALLPRRIQIIGVGGITVGGDIWEHLDCGAVVTQVVTAYIQGGQRREQVFGRLLEQYIDFCDEHGV